MTKKIAQLANSALPAATAEAAFRAGVEYAAQYIAERFTLTPRPTQTQALAEALRKVASKRTPRQVQARKKQLRREAEEWSLVPRFSALIHGREVTKTAAVNLGIGMEKAKRVRALAVQVGALARKRRDGVK